MKDIILETCRAVLHVSIFEKKSICLVTDRYETCELLSSTIDAELKTIPEWFLPSINESRVQVKRFGTRSVIYIVHTPTQLKGITIPLMQYGYIGTAENYFKVQESFSPISQLKSRTFITY